MRTKMQTAQQTKPYEPAAEEEVDPQKKVGKLPGRPKKVKSTQDLKDIYNEKFGKK